MNNTNQNRQGRLQRQAGSNGFLVDSFRWVFIRHGLTMSLLLMICVGIRLYIGGDLPSASQALGPLSKQNVLQIKSLHLGLLIALLTFVGLHWRWRGIEAQRQTFLWLAYLGMISLVEELLFRLVAPQLLQSLLGYTGSVVVSNLIFAGIHFFTLRWRLRHCIVVFLGGLGLSRLLLVTDDLILVVLVHWFFTFLNTPQPPKGTTSAP
ncbi:MAG: CPBP family intramembrane metalloprotease [Pseudomonadales bacterium]|nr:CPBP family intramembrane metalloprotease [Pseudomonadales bacterium]